MATRSQIDADTQRMAEKRGLVVDWKDLALRFLEFQSNLYPGNYPSIIRQCMIMPSDNKEGSI